MRDEAEEIATTASTPVTVGLDRSASLVSLPSLSQITTASPGMFSTGAGRHYSISSASQASYSPYIHSNQTSPAFGPQLSHIHTAPPFGNNFGIGSPALKAVDSGHTIRPVTGGAMESSNIQGRHRAANDTRSDQDLDHEAAAALSMLNNDRRSWRPPVPASADVSRSGMSVRDLLSS